jgi:hypothetical protein
MADCRSEQLANLLCPIPLHEAVTVSSWWDVGQPTDLPLDRRL